MAESSTCVLPDCKTFLKRTFGSSLQATPNFSSALKYMFSMYSLLPFKRAGVSESGLEKLALFSLFNAKHSFSFASCLLFAHRHTQTHDPCFPCGSYLLPPWSSSSCARTERTHVGMNHSESCSPNSTQREVLH